MFSGLRKDGSSRKPGVEFRIETCMNTAVILFQAVPLGRVRCQVPLHYFGYVFELYADVPDVFGKDEDHRAFFVTASAGVAEDGGRRMAAAFHLFAESVEQRAAPLSAAASLARSGAHKDLDHILHERILCRESRLPKGRTSSQPHHRLRYLKPQSLKTLAAR